MGFLLTFFLIVLLVICYLSNYVFDLVILAFSLLCVVEFRNLILKSGYPAFRFVPELACFLVYICNLIGFICNLTAIEIIILVFAVILLLYLVILIGSMYVLNGDLEKDRFREVSNMNVKQFALFKANNTLSTIAYPTILMAFAYLLNHIQFVGFAVLNSQTENVPMGLFGIILVFMIACLTDTFAMAFGKLIKGKKLCPKISPNKTISGACFGLLGGILGAFITYLVFSLIFVEAFAIVSFWQFLVVGFVGSAIAQAGDLFESFLKRRANLKDSGDLFRSHGGVLDRLDSVVFLIPFVFICLIILFA